MIVIIPDIHNRINCAETILNRHKDADQIIFTGDYFDSKGSASDDTQNTIDWLLDSIKHKNRVHLLGNHDIHYFLDNPAYICSGYNELRKMLIQASGLPQMLNKFKLFTHFKDNKHTYLISHAGVDKSFMSKNNPLENLEETCNKALYQGGTHNILCAGMFRGGHLPVGGITWHDCEESEPDDRFFHIFGHTKNYTVRYGKNWICLDTGSRHYAIYDKGEITIKTVL